MKKVKKVQRSASLAAFGEIVTEVNRIKIHDNTTMKKIRDDFYAIMRKHGVRWGIPEDNSSTNGACGEWAALVKVLMENVAMKVRFDISLFKIPDELFSYDKEPT
jgi:hypothetical protein